MADSTVDKLVHVGCGLGTDGREPFGGIGREVRGVDMLGVLDNHLGIFSAGTTEQFFEALDGKQKLEEFHSLLQDVTETMSRRKEIPDCAP